MGSGRIWVISLLWHWLLLPYGNDITVSGNGSVSLLYLCSLSLWRNCVCLTFDTVDLGFLQFYPFRKEGHVGGPGSSLILSWCLWTQTHGRGHRVQSPEKGVHLPLPACYLWHPLSAKELQGVTGKLELSKQGLFFLFLLAGEKTFVQRG